MHGLHNELQDFTSPSLGEYPVKTLVSLNFKVYTCYVLVGSSITLEFAQNGRCTSRRSLSSLSMEDWVVELLMWKVPRGREVHIR